MPLARYHQVLLAVSNNPAGLDLAGIVRSTGLPKSTSHRLATALVAVGYLEAPESVNGPYQLGPSLGELLKRYAQADRRRAAFRSALQYLVATAGESAFFAEYANGRVELVEAVPPPTSSRSYIHPGTGLRPLDRCSSSKAILAYLASDEIKRLYKAGAFEAPGLTPLPLPQVLQQLKEVHSNGYALCDGEIEEGVASIACPVAIGAMRGIYSIGIVGPAARLKSHSLPDFIEKIKKAADMASENIFNSDLNKNKIATNL